MRHAVGTRTLLDLYYFLAVTTEAWLESKIAAFWYLAVQRTGSKVSFQDCSNEIYFHCPDFRVQWKEMWHLMTSCSTTPLDQTSRCFGGWAWRWRRARRWPWWAAAAAGRARWSSSWSGSMTPWLAQWWACFLRSVTCFKALSGKTYNLNEKMTTFCGSQTGAHSQTNIWGQSGRISGTEWSSERTEYEVDLYPTLGPLHQPDPPEWTHIRFLPEFWADSQTPSPPFCLAISLTLNLRLSLILTSRALIFGF